MRTSFIHGGKDATKRRMCSAIAIVPPTIPTIVATVVTVTSPLVSVGVVYPDIPEIDKSSSVAETASSPSIAI